MTPKVKNSLNIAEISNDHEFQVFDSYKSKTETEFTTKMTFKYQMRSKHDTSRSNQGQIR